MCLSEANSSAMHSLCERLHAAIGNAAREGSGAALSISVGGACLAKASSTEDGRELLREAVRQLKRALTCGGGGVELLRTPFQPPRAA